MKPFAWEPRFDLGVPEMNDEHRILIAKMNHLQRLATFRAPRADLDRGLAELVRYTREHFASEEEYMASIGYPALSTHKRVHDDLVRRLEGFSGELEQTGMLGDAFFDFLHFWLRAHICGIDMQYTAAPVG